MKFWTVKMPRLVIALLEMSHSLRFTKSVGHVHLPSGAAPGRPFGWLENVCHRGHIKPVSSCLGQQIPGSAGGPSLRRGPWLPTPVPVPCTPRDVGAAVLPGDVGWRWAAGQVSGPPTPSSVLRKASFSFDSQKSTGCAALPRPLPSPSPLLPRKDASEE